MVNPVKQNAGQIPLSTQNFFEGDGKTVSAPWRAFLRNITLTVGLPSGGGNLPALTETVAAQQLEIDELFALEGANAGFAMIGAFVARIGVLERSVSAVVPMPAKPAQPLIDSVSLQRPVQPLIGSVSLQRPAQSFADALVSAPPGAPSHSMPDSGLAPMQQRPAALQDQPVYAPPAQYLFASNNLIDIKAPATAATNLGLGVGNTPTFSGLNTSGSSATGVTALTLLNSSVASGTGKSVSVLFQGKDTAGTLKTTAGIVTVPGDSNHVNGSLAFQVRTADALGEAGRFSSTKSFLVGYATDQAGGEKAQINGALAINSTLLVHTYTSFTNGAATAAGTLSNAPVAGNPTKWIPINDNGVTRYMPAW